MNKIKILFPAITILILSVTNSCMKDNLNTSPGVVILTTPLNLAKDVAIDDSLTWQEAIDPDGDLVKYDVYFGTEAYPKTVVSVRQEGISFTPELISGTTYYWKIIAQDGAEGTSESAVWSFTTVNIGPGDVILTSPENAAINVALNASLTWNPTTDPDGDAVTYDIYFDTSSNPTTKVSSGQTGTTFTPTLSANTTYYWKVVANDGKGGTSESAVWSFTTRNNPPGEVTLLSPDDGETDVALDASLTWNPSTDPDGDAVTYDVLLSTNANPTTVVSSAPSGTTYVPTLSANTTYYWKVVANDGKGGTSESAVWSFITRNNPPGAFNLASPTNGAINIPHDDEVLTWNTSTDPDGDAVTYDVLLSTSANPTNVVSSNQTGTSFYPTLEDGTTYYWKVIAKDGNGGSRESAIWSFTTYINNPPNSFNLSSPVNGATNVNDDNWELVWNASTDPDGDMVTYDVIIGTNSNPTNVVSSNQTGTSFYPTLEDGTTYYWKVITKDGNGGSRESAIWSFTTYINNPPGAFNLISPANESINFGENTLVWEASTDPNEDTVTYDVYLRKDSSDNETLVSEGQSGTTFSPMLEDGNLYYWRVVAKDGNGGNRESATWSFTQPAM